MHQFSLLAAELLTLPALQYASPLALALFTRIQDCCYTDFPTLRTSSVVPLSVSYEEISDP